jgi:hypothetical protein
VEHLHNDLDLFPDRISPRKLAARVGEEGNACSGKARRKKTARKT